jgi:rod shape-determining protein MreC
MARLPEGLSRFRDQIVLVICVALSLWAISLDNPTRLDVATRLAHRVFTPVEWIARVVDDLGSLRKENEELRGKIAAMELDAVQIGLERRRFEELERRAGFYEQNRGKLAPALVLELTVNRIPVQAKIRIQSDDSLRVWQPVVTENGLVGRVRELLDPKTALVELLTEADARISVESVSSGVTGLLRYNGRIFLMDHVPQGDPIAVGDEIVTSGLGGTVPRGIPVGRVTRAELSKVELFQHVEIEAAVHFSALSQVYVITRPGPWYSRHDDSVLPPSDETSRGAKP